METNSRPQKMKIRRQKMKIWCRKMIPRRGWTVSRHRKMVRGAPSLRSRHREPKIRSRKMPHRCPGTLQPHRSARHRRQISHRGRRLFARRDGAPQHVCGALKSGGPPTTCERLNKPPARLASIDLTDSVLVDVPSFQVLLLACGSVRRRLCNHDVVSRGRRDYNAVGPRAVRNPRRDSLQSLSMRLGACVFICRAHRANQPTVGA